MEQFKTFLDTSTIHGLSWISGTRKWPRLFWIIIVFGGFSSAVYLIYESFDNWKQSPITTTIETLPISQITFPNVTVCPPRNLFLNLNYDISQSEKVKLDKEKRVKMIEVGLEVVQEKYYLEIMKNLSKVDDPDRYYNWYHGFSRIKYPTYPSWLNNLRYEVETTATSGNISTQYYGDKFDANKVDGCIHIVIYVSVPPYMREDNATQILFEIDKITMEELSNNDKIIFDSDTALDPHLTHWSKNMTAPLEASYSISLARKVLTNDLKNVKLENMPGFRFTWNYHKQMNPWSGYRNESITKNFVR